MKNYFPVLLLFMTFALASADNETNHSEGKKVFICDSESAKKYHLKSDCKGLEKCEQEVLKVTKEEAIERGKTELCGYED